MLHVLIVEDEEIIRSGLQYTIDWLSMDSAVVGTACDGQEGLEMIKEYSPDIVISDIRMPRMDGLQMIQQAQDSGFNFIPIILTSYSDFSYAKQAINLRVFDYILKPLDELKLKEVVKKASDAVKQKNQLQSLKKIADLASADEKTRNQIVLKTDSSNPAINTCLKCIEKDYGGHPNIETLASELKVSPSYLSRLFKKHTGTTFLDFLNRYRVQKAVNYLSQNKYRVYEVASMCGFSDYKRFYEVFKSYTGINPTDFVKQGACVIKK